MISSCQTKDNKIICNDYSSALGTLKEKLYNGDYYTSTHSSVCVAYNRRIHRYQVFSCQDNRISMNENPRSKENYDTIRILDIPTSSDDYDKYMESQMELAKLNNNLLDRITDRDEEEQKRELRKELIDSIVYIQNPSVGEKNEVAYFEYNNGNNEIAKRCISAIREKYISIKTMQAAISIKNIQQMLSEYDIPNRIAKELAILILKEKIVD
jgi:predicted transcriptional regulator